MVNGYKKILITGVNGFIGKKCADYLRKEHVLIGLDTHQTCPQDNVDVYVPMVLPDSGLEGVIKEFEPDCCIHCAGSASVGCSMTKPAADFSAGPDVVFGLLESIRKSAVKCRVIFISSAAVYGNPKHLPIKESAALSPVSPYGYHKMICEKIFEEFAKIYGLQSTILRVFSCYGEGLKKQLIWDVCKKISEDNCVLFGTGQQTRDFIHVDDLVQLIKLVIDSDTANGIFNAATGKQHSVEQIARMVAEKMDYPAKKIKFKGQKREGDPEFWQADISKIKNIGFKPSISLKEGIAGYVQWFQEVINEKCYQYS